uniref:Putative ovule protein n=1 Tax=Solanum chacoense TaxID=4108 RepID=A0A0V0H5Z2_SOLCH
MSLARNYTKMGRSSSVNRLLICDSALKYSVFSCPSCQPKSSSYTFPDNLHVFHRVDAAGAKRSHGGGGGGADEKRGNGEGFKWHHSTFAGKTSPISVNSP